MDSTTLTTEQKASVLTVTQLTQAIKVNLETAFRFVSLQGEVSNFKQQTSGHLYFSLKDANAQIAAVMFQGDASRLKTLPKAGDQVIVKGEINVYPTKGNYQMIIRELSYVGLGELLLKLEQLKIKLHKMGWFKADRKKSLPKFPRIIGVVTSPTGAVIQDILNILNRRFSGFHLILNPVKVQGEGAAREIAQAIEQFNRYHLVDVMIVGRGGGSLEDLWAFNEEVVAEAIFHSHIPIISAVGHETDHCIADYVADVRAPTPSAAAEIVIAEKAQCLDHLAVLRRRLSQTVTHLIKQDRRRLEGMLKQPMLTNPYALLGPWMQKLDDQREDLDRIMQQKIQQYRLKLESYARQVQGVKPSTLIAHYKQSLKNKSSQLDQAWGAMQSQRRLRFNADRERKRLAELTGRRVMLLKERLAKLIDHMHAIDPKNLLRKGYSILFSEKDNSVINSVQAIEKEQRARLMLSDGEALITINQIDS
jgi:exodeoxyribonuclease VII large subunit